RLIRVHRSSWSEHIGAIAADRARSAPVRRDVAPARGGEQSDEHENCGRARGGEVTWALVATLFGTFFFAISGCLLAAGRGFDLVGSLLLGALTGLGGGVIRDLIIGAPPAAFDEPINLVPPVLAALLVYLLARGVQRFRRTLLVFDAGGLALFCTTGTVTALNAGLNSVSATVLGVTTGVGGGLLRDVVANRVPQLFN